MTISHRICLWLGEKARDDARALKSKYKRSRVVRHINQATCYTQTITDNKDILACKANGY